MQLALVRRVPACLLTFVIAVGLVAGVGSSTASADPLASQWAQLRQCESSGNYAINTGNGYYGAYQFNQATWSSVGGSGRPDQASPAEQDYRALYLYRMRGWQPWTCAQGFASDSDAGSGRVPTYAEAAYIGGGGAGPAAGDRVTAGQTLGSVTSINGQYQLYQQSDGGLVEYGNGGVVFSTSTRGGPGASTVMQSDGNLVTYAADGTTPLFDTHTFGNPGAQAVLQSDGNLVVYAPSGKALWASYGPADLLGTYSSQATPQLSFDRARGSNGEQYLTSRDYRYTARVGDNQLTVLTTGRPADFTTPTVATSNDFTRVEMQSDGNLVLSSCTFSTGSPGQYTAGTCTPTWSTRTQNNPGAHTRMQTDGNLVIYTAAGRALWSSKYGRTY
jgi:hypothetical protein